MYKAIYPMFLFFSFFAHSQRERIYVDLDKYLCRSGDTVWLKAFVFQGQYPSTVSTNLYIGLYDKRAIPIKRYVFPILHGQSIGQLIISEKDSIPTGNYYLIARTRQQMSYDTSDYFTLPLLIYNKHKPGSLHPKKQILSPPFGTSGYIKDIIWITTVHKDTLSSLLRIDSASAPRRLRLVKPTTRDTALTANIALDNAHKKQYALFPTDTLKDYELLLLYEDTVLIGRQYINLRHASEQIQLHTDTLNTSPLGYNSWRITLPDTTRFFASISVTDADRSIPSPGTILRLQDAYTDDLSIAPSQVQVDSTYITIDGKAVQSAGKLTKTLSFRELTIAAARDTKFLFTDVVKLDSAGKFTIDSLFYFGNIDFHFQINQPGDDETKNVTLKLARFVPPSIDASSFVANWEDDTLPVSVSDTAFTRDEQRQYELSKMKTLKPAVVRGRKNLRDELDARYSTGRFSEPALYVYDLRKDTTDHYKDLFLYLDAQKQRLYYDRQKDALMDVHSHPIHFFVDEIEYFDPYAVRVFDVDRLAYIKVLESDFLSTRRPSLTITDAPQGPFHIINPKTPLNVCIYTKKGIDFRSTIGRLKKLSVKGYDPILRFHPDRTTLYYNPMASGHQFNIQFNNSAHTRRFRLKVEGVSYTGKLVHYETIIE